ncbi:MAG: sugar phosphate isomerase/epimerase [Anaerolineae bacterium]|nr:sugar phosphate isomerase/epimerase [Anaerolineae bacterium]
MPYPLEDDITAAARAGFQGIEIWNDKLLRYLETHSLSNLSALLSKHNLTPVALCPLLIWPFRDTEPARASFHNAVDSAVALGIELLIACPDFQPARLSREQALEIHGKELRSLAALAADNGLRLAVEPIGGHTLVPGPTEAFDLIRRAGSPNNVGVVVDTFHYFRSQVTPTALEAIPLEKLYIIHVNDCEDLPFNELQDKHRLFPTLGVIPLEQQLSIIKSKGYDGDLSVEIFRPEYWSLPIQQIADDSYRYVNKLADALQVGTTRHMATTVA